MNRFSQKTIEELNYYVYILVDPRDNKIFYVGKGKDNRVFAHIACSLNEELESDKLNIIREITLCGKTVKHFIVRHGLNENEAFLVESVLIDFLSYSDFFSVCTISNIQAGHHQWFKGIKTVEELEQLYACEPLNIENIQHNLITININKTYNIKNDYHPNIYEATRKSWKINERRLPQIEYVLSEFRGIVRAIFKPTKWLKNGDRWMFEGIEITDKEITDLYLNKSLPEKKKGEANPIKYFTKHQ
ncbi:hypothetical protein M2132_001429 [Dysgonomonas sp. PH5-45]|uniref:LEM-3-like GIY-YIG domain-containing protein n=1 Tax=unclassified Dysgonomonas TaxID=2630389 RepID=UPI0024759655|nr:MULTISPECIES: excinuclease ABC [unclassified Dysgonomonas]MDH6355092.1 hypothetical protein [Dysgonomonas sp. PH5-45]MDH6387992.1 hypothetical protein [Dysgonomonas sp. PH5-37]